MKNKIQVAKDTEDNKKFNKYQKRNTEYAVDPLLRGELLIKDAKKAELLSDSFVSGSQRPPFPCSPATPQTVTRQQTKSV